MTTFGTKWITKIGCWNITTLRESTKIKQVEKEMKNYELDVLRLSEIRWEDFGEITTADGNYFLYSGIKENMDHRNGVGLLLRKKKQRRV